MNYPDNTLQAAIDAALIETKTEVCGQSFAACPETYPKVWPKESTARLALAKAFLAKLPEVQPILADDGRSLGQVAEKAYDNALSRPSDVSHEHCMEAAAQAVVAITRSVIEAEAEALAQAIRRMEAVSDSEITNAYWQAGDGYENIRSLLIAAAMGEAEQQADSTDWKAKYEQAEADLAALKSSSIGILRPLAEAGPVPDGCARVYGHVYDDMWYLGWQKDDKDTHFADIRLPSTETSAPVNEQTKQQVPLGPEDVMPGAWFRSKNGSCLELKTIAPGFVTLRGSSQAYTWASLQVNDWQINHSIPLTGRWDATAWEPCYKLI